METPAGGEGSDTRPFVVPRQRETLPRALVLVIDDDESVRDMVAAVLELHGYDVTCAAGALDGLERLFLETPAAIVTDLQMVGMDGVDFCRAVRAFERYDRVPIHVITAAEESDRVAEARLIGNVRVLFKPAAINELPRSLIEVAG